MKSKQLIMAIVLVLTLFGTVAAQYFEPAVTVNLDEVVGLDANNEIPLAGVAELIIPINLKNVDSPRDFISNGYDFECSDGINYDSVTGLWNPNYPWDWDHAIDLGIFPPYFDQGIYVHLQTNATGDVVGFPSMSGGAGQGLPVDFDGIGQYITLWNVTGDVNDYIIMDSTYWLPANYWLWDDVLWNVYWGGPYTFPFPETVEGVEGAGLPTAFGLKQNYPNPFNPGTEVQFDVPRHSHVNISIYNVLGQNVKTLVNEELAAGSYVTQWDGRSEGGSAVSSGVYFYKMQAGDYVETKKMIMLK